MPEADEPNEHAAPKPARADRFSMYAEAAFPTSIWIVVCASIAYFIAADGIATWKALLVGFAVGTIFVGLMVALLLVSGERTCCELGCGLTVMLILVIVIYPVARYARDRAQREAAVHARARNAAAQRLRTHPMDAPNGQPH